MIIEKRITREKKELMPLRGQNFPRSQNFVDPSPLLKFGWYRQNCWYFVPKINYKVRIFSNFRTHSPYFRRKPNLTDDVN